MQRMLIGLLGLLLGPAVLAAQFAVSPVRVDFSAGDKTSSVVINNMGDTPLRVALDARRWQQDQDGADVYTPTTDLLFFPKQAEIAPRSQRVVRIGMLVPRAANEQAYRIYINEQPPLKSEVGSSQLAMVLSFGVPVFIQPLQVERSAVAEKVSLQRGDLLLTLKNTGNTSLRLASVKNKALKLDQQEFTDWYLLAGTERSYRFHLDACVPGEHQVDIAFDQYTLNLPVQVSKAACTE